MDASVPVNSFSAFPPSINNVVSPPAKSPQNRSSGNESGTSHSLNQNPAVDGLKIMLNPQSETDSGVNSWDYKSLEHPTTNESLVNGSKETVGSFLSDGQGNGDAEVAKPQLVPFPLEEEPLSEYWNEEENRYYTQQEMDEWNAQYYENYDNADQIPDFSNSWGNEDGQNQKIAVESFKKEIEFESQSHEFGLNEEQSYMRNDQEMLHFENTDNDISSATEASVPFREYDRAEGGSGNHWQDGEANWGDITTDDVIIDSTQNQDELNPIHQQLHPIKPQQVDFEQDRGGEKTLQNYNEELTHASQEEILRPVHTLASNEIQNEPAVLCWNCQRGNVVDANFCTNCGSRLKEKVPTGISNGTGLIAPVGIITSLKKSAETSSLHVSDPLGRLFGHCFASFGVGGKLLYSCPEKQVVFGISAGVPASIEKACPGHLKVASSSNFLSDYEKYAPSPIFGNVLVANEWPAKESLLCELDQLLPYLTGYEALFHTLRECIDQEFK